MFQAQSQISLNSLYVSIWTPHSEMKVSVMVVSLQLPLGTEIMNCWFLFLGNMNDDLQGHNKFRNFGVAWQPNNSHPQVLGYLGLGLFCNFFFLWPWFESKSSMSVCYVLSSFDFIWSPRLRDLIPMLNLRKILIQMSENIQLNHFGLYAKLEKAETMQFRYIHMYVFHIYDAPALCNCLILRALRFVQLT